ncbi:hypothetical protein [Bifidobacterium olomucense]|nr:hypothetical protein [Bifidobacterium sp. DSM 109959]
MAGNGTGVYHVNANGDVVACAAHARACPNGGPHFTSMEEGHRFVEERLAREYATSRGNALRKTYRVGEDADVHDALADEERERGRVRNDFLRRIRAARAGRRDAVERGNGKPSIDTPQGLCRYALDVMDGYDREFLKRTGDWDESQLRDCPAEWIHQFALSYAPRYRELDLQASRTALIYGAEGRYGDGPVTDRERRMFAGLMRLAYVTKANVSAGVWLRLNDEWNDKWADPNENREQVARTLARVGIEARVNGLAKRYARGEYAHPFDSVLGEAQRGVRSVMPEERLRDDVLVERSPLRSRMAISLASLGREDVEQRFPLDTTGMEPELAKVIRRAYWQVFIKLDESRRAGDWNRFSDQALMLRRIIGVRDKDDDSPLDLRDDQSCLAYAAAMAGGSVSPTTAAMPRLLDWQDREEKREAEDKQRRRTTTNHAAIPDAPSDDGDVLMRVEEHLEHADAGRREPIHSEDRGEKEPSGSAYDWSEEDDLLPGTPTSVAQTANAGRQSTGNRRPPMRNCTPGYVEPSNGNGIGHETTHGGAAGIKPEGNGGRAKGMYHALRFVSRRASSLLRRVPSLILPWLKQDDAAIRSWRQSRTMTRNGSNGRKPINQRSRARAK